MIWLYMDYAWKKGETRSFQFGNRGVSTDTIVLDEMFKQNCYRWFGNELSGARIIDLGANIGSFAIPASVHNRVTAYEPCDRNFRALVDNMLLNKVNFGIENCAVGESGFGYIGGYGGCSRLYKDVSELPQFRTREDIKIPVLGLDQVINEEIDFLKVDIEGSEYEAILGASPDTLKKIKKFAMEVHPDLRDAETHNKFMEKIKEHFDIEYDKDAFDRVAGGMMYGVRK